MRRDLQERMEAAVYNSGFSAVLTILGTAGAAYMQTQTQWFTDIPTLFRNSQAYDIGDMAGAGCALFAGACLTAFVLSAREYKSASDLSERLSNFR